MSLMNQFMRLSNKTASRRLNSSSSSSIMYCPYRRGLHSSLRWLMHVGIALFALNYSALMISHFRRRNEEPSEQPSLMDRCSVDPIKKTESYLDDGDSGDCSMYLEQTANLPMNAGLLKQVWELMGGFSPPWSTTPDRKTMTQVDRVFADSMDVIRSIAINIGLPSQLPESFHAKLPFRRSNTNHLKSLMDDLELLTFYSKSGAFLKAVATPAISVDFLKTAVDRLENAAVKLLASSSSEVRLSPQTLSEFSSDRDLLHCLDMPAFKDLTPLPAGKPKDQLLRFGFCQYQLALFLANLSTIPESVTTLSLPCLAQWLDLWSESQDIRLNLLSTKIRFNLTSHLYWRSVETDSELNPISVCDIVDDGDANCCGKNEVESMASVSKQPKFVLDDQSPTPPNYHAILDPPVILGPDVYKLDLRSASSNPPVVDVIFINGMLGSVFHTWRQHDNPDTECIGEEQSQTGTTEQVNCWPQEWLSRDFPGARILGVNANLKPFIWNPLCPADRVNRRIDQRAHEIFHQLLAAGVGRRPIIWISHSAGGIVTKEVLKISDTGVSVDCTSSTNNGIEERSASRLKMSASSGNAISSTDSAGEEADGEDSENNRCFSSSMSFKRPFKSMPKMPSFLPLLRGNNKKAAGYQVVSSDFEEQVTVDAAEADIEDDDDVAFPWVSQTGIQSPGSSIAEQTCGIIFLSVPHRGNQSMFFLYQFPMCFALTPEAKQLQNNSVSIKCLHEWFVDWVIKRKIPIVNMIENKDTIINRWYHTRIVPFDAQDLKFSEVILVDADHAEVCKPKNRNDEVYTKISEFIHQQISSL